MEYKDYYAILGLQRTASAAEIKQAYRKLARKYHPDVSKEQNAEEQFKNVQEAYEVLKDAEKRKAYDELGNQWRSGQEFRPPPGWDQNRTRFYSGGDGFSDADLGGFSDFFSQLFGGARMGGGRSAHSGFAQDDNLFGERSQRQRGQDQHVKISISLNEAYTGCSKSLQLRVPELDRQGQVHYQTRTLKVNIPAGSLSGQQLRLSKQGSPGAHGGLAGDLYLEIEITPHPLFTLKERDVYLTLPITPWEAALGAEIKVPTLAGTVGLKLAAGSQGGQKLRLKGKGLPHKSTSGDQYVILQIEVPKANTAEEKAFYQNMAKLMPFQPRKDWNYD